MSLKNRIDKLEREEGAKRERVFAITGCDETGHYYANGKEYFSREELEAAYPNAEITLYIISVRDEFLRQV